MSPDEMFYVLEGELTGYCRDDHWTATAGSFVFVPRDCVHGFTVAGDGPARAIVITGPPGLDVRSQRAGRPRPAPSAASWPTAPAAAAASERRGGA
ncbi:MAG TPA: cupin domain-containing protein [Streptosporangiaceae bacterium]|nr:cupin domain-containing protein [Streptosporangiaceae bacterium]